MLFEQVQQRLAFDHCAAFTKSVYECRNLADLKIPSKILFAQITDLVFPDERFELVNKGDPQDIKEELN